MLIVFHFLNLKFKPEGRALALPPSDEGGGPPWVVEGEKNLIAFHFFNLKFKPEGGSLSDFTGNAKA